MKSKYCFVAISTLALCLFASAQQEARTSENTPQLKEILKRRPESDLNKNGILTLEEVREARKKLLATQQKKPVRTQKPAYPWPPSTIA